MWLRLVWLAAWLLSGAAMAQEGAKAGWDWGCSENEVSNEPDCLVYDGSMSVVVGLRGKEAIVLVGKNHRPDTEVSLRIDGGRIFTYQAGKGTMGFLREDDQIVTLFKRGSEAAVRYTTMPDNVVTQRVSLKGFTAAFNAARKRYDEMSKTR
jgi:hypothetical protein